MLTGCNEDLPEGLAYTMINREGKEELVRVEGTERETNMWWL